MSEQPALAFPARCPVPRQARARTGNLNLNLNLNLNFNLNRILLEESLL